MRRISAFTFVHNALAGGYPIVEAVRAVQPYVDEVVAVDMASDDGTRDILQKLDCRILDGEWGNEGGETLNNAFVRSAECENDLVMHFEADEVYSPELLGAIMKRLFHGIVDIAVHRIQVEQNFQRVRWYPVPVHRVWFPKGGIRKDGASTSRHGDAAVIPPDEGLLWDVRACFRDNVVGRETALAYLFNEDPGSVRATPKHFMEERQVEDMDDWLSGPRWMRTKSPLDLPDCLKPLVGMTRYHAKI